MASTSNHYGDVANWIEKVINSCETPLQEITARHLTRQFEIQYKDIDRKFNWNLSIRLKVALDKKIYERLDRLHETLLSPK